MLKRPLPFCRVVTTTDPWTVGGIDAPHWRCRSLKLGVSALETKINNQTDNKRSRCNKSYADAPLPAGCPPIRFHLIIFVLFGFRFNWRLIDCFFCCYYCCCGYETAAAAAAGETRDQRRWQREPKSRRRSRTVGGLACAGAP